MAFIAPLRQSRFLCCTQQSTHSLKSLRNCSQVPTTFVIEIKYTGSKPTRGDGMPVIYADVVWLINLLMDAVLLATTCWLLKKPIRTLRILLGAAFGATYALFLFAPALSMLTAWPGKAVASLVMVGIAIIWKSWLDLARVCVAFYFVAVVFAGSAVALHYAVPGVSLGKSLVLSGSRVAFVASFESLALLVAVPLGIALIKFALGKAKRIRLRAAMHYDVAATVFGQQIRFVGLADSGNQLRDPITRRPVCLVNASVLAPVLPMEIRSAAREGKDVLARLPEVSDPAFSGKFVLVPYRGAGGRQQLTLAVRPDSLEIYRQGKLCGASNDVYLALHTEALSLDDHFQAILHIDLITEDDGFEANMDFERPQHEAAYSPPASVDSNSSEVRWRS